MSRFGLAVRRYAGKQRHFGSILLRLSFFFKSCGLWTLSCDFVPHNYETLKWLSSPPTLMQKPQSGGESVAIGTQSPSPSTSIPPPLSPFLISLMASLGVKHHV